MENQSDRANESGLERSFSDDEPVERINLLERVMQENRANSSLQDATTSPVIPDAMQREVLLRRAGIS